MKKRDSRPVDSFGRRLQEARFAQAARWGRAITQSEVGRDVGVTGVTVGRYEAGAKEPTLEMIGKLAAALECDPGWLAFGKASTGGPTEVVPSYLLRESTKVRSNAFEDAADAIDEVTEALKRGAPLKVLRLAAVRAVMSTATSIRQWFDIFGQGEAGSVIAQHLEEGFLERLVATKTRDDIDELVDDLSRFGFELTKSFEEAPVPGLAHSLNEIVGVLIRDEIRAEKGKSFAAQLLPAPTPRQLDRASTIRLAALARRRDLSLDEVLEKLVALARQVMTSRVDGMKVSTEARIPLLQIAERATGALALELTSMIEESEAWKHPATKTRAEMVQHTGERIDATTGEIQRVHKYRSDDESTTAVSDRLPARIDGEAVIDVGGSVGVVLRDQNRFATDTRKAAEQLRLEYSPIIETAITPDMPPDLARDVIVEGLRGTAMQMAAAAADQYPELDHGDLVRVVKETTTEARRHYRGFATTAEMLQANCGATVAQSIAHRLDVLLDGLGAGSAPTRRRKSPTRGGMRETKGPSG